MRMFFSIPFWMLTFLERTQTDSRYHILEHGARSSLAISFLPALCKYSNPFISFLSSMSSSTFSSPLNTSIAHLYYSHLYSDIFLYSTNDPCIHPR
ncbi:hypothetical protein BKA70DRAFT_752188 [Coprinopsis sp. MPI-PUGE-AT-0042]|nr:hypothetical protein BKA70DRAFT_752188 [Coprinopsis sp. MPI-PUGE-AT-0042]